MASIYITSDPHFGHQNILKFTRDNGSLMRCFPDAGTMDDYIVEQWNSVVRPQDKVYCLGDVAMKRKDIATVGRCNGHKRLVRGNHDIYRTKEYMQFFEEIYAYRKIENLFMSHIPIHPESLHHDWVNVHGHVHNNVGPLHFGPRYFNVCVEVTGYRPLAIEEVRQLTRKQIESNTNRW